MIRILKTVILPAPDLSRVKDWYATVFDPFGNVFGIIENPHFKLPAT